MLDFIRGFNALDMTCVIFTRRELLLSEIFADIAVLTQDLVRLECLAKKGN